MAPDVNGVARLSRRESAVLDARRDEWGRGWVTLKKMLDQWPPEESTVWKAGHSCLTLQSARLWSRFPNQVIAILPHPSRTFQGTVPEAAQTHSLLTAGQGGQNLLCSHPRAHFCGRSDQTSAKPCLPHVFSHTLRRVVLSSSFQSHQARQKSLLRWVLVHVRHSGG